MSNLFNSGRWISHFSQLHNLNSSSKFNLLQQLTVTPTSAVSITKNGFVNIMNGKEWKSNKNTSENRTTQNVNLTRKKFCFLKWKFKKKTLSDILRRWNMLTHNVLYTASVICINKMLGSNKQVYLYKSDVVFN